MSTLPFDAACLDCGYSLRDLRRSICPECGCGCDIADPLTYRNKATHRAPIAGLVIGMLIFSGLIGWAIYAKGTLDYFLAPFSLIVAAILPLVLMMACFGLRGFHNSVATLVGGTTPAGVRDAASFFKTAVAFSLSCGFLGTILGTIVVLRGSSDYYTIGYAIGHTLLPLFYGTINAVIFYAIAVFIPHRQRHVKSAAQLERSNKIAGVVAGCTFGFGATAVVATICTFTIPF